jgi:hypothetical protein
MKTTHKTLIPMLVILLLAACSTSTRITGSWIDPETKQKPLNDRTIFITSLARNIEVRTKLENSMAEQAALRNVKTEKSTNHLSAEFYQKLPTKQQLLSSIKRTGASSILTMTLINKESNNRYVRGNNMYMPFRYGGFGGFYNYYNFMYPFMMDPGYYVTDKRYFLETNLYDVETEKLIWSAQSETVNPGSINNFVRDYPKVVLEQMAKDGVIRPTLK